MIEGTKIEVNEDSIRYQARTVLSNLATDIAKSRYLKSTETQALVIRASKIRLFLKALDYTEYLTREQREILWYGLIQVAGIYDFPTSPILELRNRPNILLGYSVTNNITGGNVTFDNVPTDASLNAVTSNGIFDALATKAALSHTHTASDVSEVTNKRFVTDAQEAKIDHLTVTQAVDLDAMEAKLAHISVTQAVDLDVVETKINHITVTQAVDLDAIEARVNELDAAVVLKGSWAANAGTFPGAGVAQAGWSYVISIAGTVDGVTFSVGDRIIALTDNASTTVYANNWLKADYSDLVTSIDTQTGAITLGGVINSLTAKTTPVDADTTVISDSAASNASKKVTWANVKATLKTYFDTLYTAAAVISDAAFATSWNADTTTAPSRNAVYDALAGLQTKIVEIGDWNMDTTSDVNIAHGLADHTKIRSISVMIRGDSGGIYSLMGVPDIGSAALLSGGIALNDTGGATPGITSTNIRLSRVTGGTFDGTEFDSTSYNRGFITIMYVA